MEAERQAGAVIRSGGQAAICRTSLGQEKRGTYRRYVPCNLFPQAIGLRGVEFDPHPQCVGRSNCTQNKIIMVQ